MSQKYRAPAVKTFLPQIRNTLRSVCQVHLLKPEFVSICWKIEKSLVSWHACLAPSQAVHAVVALLCNKAFRTYNDFKFLFHSISKMQRILPMVCIEPNDTVVLWSERQKCVFHDIFIFNKIWGVFKKQRQLISVSASAWHFARSHQADTWSLEIVFARLI